MSRKRNWKGEKKMAKKKKAKAMEHEMEEQEEEEVPLTRIEEDSLHSESSDDGENSDEEAEETSDDSDDDDKGKKKSSSQWVNRQRVLLFSSRGIGYRGRHLMDDLRQLMPHSKPDSKLQRRTESLFVINEIAEMKNCNKTVFFEARKNRPDLYMWAVNAPRGPSAKFQVENVHTMAELKMTGNCLKSSRPLLSFDPSFEKEAHLTLLKELFVQIFGVPNKHPKSQPFFDHVFTFSVVDNKIWFRNFQIIDETGAMAEIGPRFVLNTIKVFEGGFSGATLWSNADYITPTANRSMLKKIKASKYLQNVQSKAQYEAGKPTGDTYNMDKTDEVFKEGQTEPSKDDQNDEKFRKPQKLSRNKKRKLNK